jgi:hypothetical protein
MFTDGTVSIETRFFKHTLDDLSGIGCSSPVARININGRPTWTESVIWTLAALGCVPLK